MDILDAAEINAEIAVDVEEELDVGFHKVILKESLNSDSEDAVAPNDMGPHAEEDLTHLFFPADVPENERQRRQAEHHSSLPSQFRSYEWRYQ